MASDLITLDQLKELVDTDLTDDALERIVDGVDRDIIRAYGPHDGERVFMAMTGRGELYVWLPSPAASVASVTEQNDSDDSAETVATTKYALAYGGRCLRRTDSRYWKRTVNVTYTPVADNARRTQALVDIVKVEVQYTGLDEEEVGPFQSTSLDRSKERHRILEGLRQPYAGAGLLR